MQESKKSRNNGRCYVVGEIYHVEHMGKDFVKSALLLYKTIGQNSGSSDYFDSFNLLMSQALENLPKSIIATRIALLKNNKSIEEIHCAINKELGCLGHKLDNIFNEVPELKKTLNIINIERVNNTISGDIFVDEFRFTIKDSSRKEKVLRIKNLEAARYGVFARNKDVGFTLNYNIKDMANFIKNLVKEVGETKVKMINQFDTKFGIKC